MKKMLSILFSFIICFNVYADEIQLTDYNYTYAKRMLDGYSVVAFSDRYEYNNFYYDKIEEGYLKQNGTQLYNSGDFSALYGKTQLGYVNFWQFWSGNYFTVFSAIQPYNLMTRHLDYCINDRSEYVDYKSEVSKYNQTVTRDEKMEMLKMNIENEEAECDRVDRSYTFKEKEINGTVYYALFKELGENEVAADFAPTERPNEQYAENIGKMAADKLLFNNEQCFYDKGITKLDFGIVLGRALCIATGYNIDNFTSDTHFVDVNHPYCLYLADKGILGSDNDLYINEKAISQSTVLSALNRTAADNHILAEWSKVKEIRNTEEDCPRELAYSEIYKLYELLQNPDTPKDIGAMAGIYIIIGSLLILFVGSFLNDKFKCKTVK